MPFNVGPMELVIVLVIALIVLGPKRLPEAGRSIGKGMREFKDSLSGDSRDDDDDEYAPLEQHPLQQLGLGLVARTDHLHERALGVLGADLPRTLAARRLARSDSVGVHQRDAAAPAEPLPVLVPRRAGGADEH